MPKVKDMSRRAERLLVSRHLELVKKADRVDDGTRKIHSMSTFMRYKQALGQAGKWAHQNHNITRLDRLTPDIAKAYLQQRIEDGIGQKQLDNDRAAMQFVVGKLERLKTRQPQKLVPRAYTAWQAIRIAARQGAHNGLATKIAYNAGLRAHELITLRRPDEVAPTVAKQWRDDLFHGRDGERYVVTGKGGLTRQVLIDPSLAPQLEARRLASPIDIKDRKIHYQMHYDIGRGHAWSKSFSEVSLRELGWSSGGHGLRHAYAQDRLEHLLCLGYTAQDAKQLVSQELGHFRESIVDIYLR